MVKADQLDEADFDNFLVCRKWRALETKRGDQDRIISGNILKVKVKHFSEVQDHRMTQLSEYRNI